MSNGVKFLMKKNKIDVIEGYGKVKPGKKVGDWAPYDYPGRKAILWDGDNMKVTNYDKANEHYTVAEKLGRDHIQAEDQI